MPDNKAITTSIIVQSGSPLDADRKAKALATLSVLPADCLEILASKAHKPGVVGKIKMFQNLI